MEEQYGPTLSISKEIHATKYRGVGESFKDSMTRVANALKDNDEHFHKFRDVLLNMRFLPAGRVQTAMGSPRLTTPYNCFVSKTIPDSMDGIMQAATEAAQIMRLGGGIGYDFSTLRPRGANISSIGSRSSGPISFMDIFDSVCKTIASAGHRRGAQMGVLRVDHPDIEEFVKAKATPGVLTQFNISVGVTDEFMQAVLNDDLFDLKFDGRVYKTIKANNLWEEIMRNNWDWAEPGVLFLDTINEYNNLHYCEEIAATNPCAEQPLPPYGACLLGSFNLVKYIDENYKVDHEYYKTPYRFNWDKFLADIPIVVRAMDNIVDRAVYPLEEHRKEAQSKRRMGLGVTGVANAMEALGLPYGSPEAREWLYNFLKIFTNACYSASIDLAKEKGPFPLFDSRYLESAFVSKLDNNVREALVKYGIRNSHLTSIAPTGTISLTADNISSGIEPTFSESYDRIINTFDGQRVERVVDYGVRVFGNKPLTADKLTPDQHLGMLIVASEWMDSSVSKTCNIGPDVTYEEFKDIYIKAWESNCKGCTTFRPSGKRFGILHAPLEDDVEELFEKNDAIETEFDEGGACYIDPLTGLKKCE